MRGKQKLTFFIIALFFGIGLNVIQVKADNEIILFDNNSLPKSLLVIEKAAFEGTALSNIDLPQSLQYIGDNAFANIPTLKNITIPNSTTYIGNDAFKGSNQVTITSAPKSYARAWAQENHIPFNPIVSFYAFDNTVIQIPSFSTNRNALQKIVLNDNTSETQKKTPTGRTTGELHVQRYEECMAFHIQGRSPPMA